MKTQSQKSVASPYSLREVRPSCSQSRSISSASFILFASFALLPFLVQAEPMDHWTKVTVPDNVLRSPSEMVFINGEYWAVGDSGKVQHSGTGTNWEVVQTPAGGSLSSIAYGNGVYVATGFYLTILSSPNGADWTVRAEDPSAGFRAFNQVIFADGRFVAVGGQGEVRISTNGIDWTPAAMSGTDFYPNGIAWNDGLYVAVGNLDGSHTVQTSLDGITWTRRTTSFTYSLKEVTFFNGLFIAGDVSLLATSPDGISWTKVPNLTFKYSNMTINGLDVLNGRVFAYGRSGLLMSSTNGADWVTHETNTSSDVTSLAYDGNNLLLSRYSIISSGSGPWKSDPWAPVSTGGGDPSGGGSGGGSEDRIANISTRAWVGTADSTLITGFAIQGPGSEKLLIRGVGPTLGGFGVQGTLADPQIKVFNGSNALVASNDDWSSASNVAELESVTAAVGAFPLTNASKDAALVVTLPQGSYTIQISGKAGTTGIALAEVYDTESGGACKLINISSRALIGSGENATIPGFVVSGSVPKKLLVRGVGPTLGSFGVSGVVADPTVAIFNESQSKVAENDNWGAAADQAGLAGATAAVGAFPLVADSLDAAMIVTLSPGAYTVVVAGKNGGTGVGLVEVYEIP